MRASTAVQNAEIGRIFEQLADLLELQGANQFRVRAYRNAARIVMNWPKPFEEIVRSEEKLPKMPGIGSDLAGKIEEIVRTGKLGLLEETRKKFPRQLVELLKIPSLGPKRVMYLENTLGIRSIRQLESAARAGKIRELRGFGEKMEKRILEELGAQKGVPTERLLLFHAEQVAQKLLEFLKSCPGVLRVEAAGSLRRRKETVGDLDLLVAGEPGCDVLGRMAAYEGVSRVLAQGRTKVTVILSSGVQVDVRLVEERSFGAALHYFTGSKAHNIAVRTLGIKRKLKINEYGVFRGTRRIGGATEQEVFASVGLPWIAPELRENSGEIEAASRAELPELVELSQIRGDLHSHTVATDGRMTIEQMARAARDRGYEYLAITDHSRHLSVASGLDARRLAAQMRQIDKLNSRLRGIRILRAIEVDILEDGSLDLPDAILEDTDITVCSIHYKFDLPIRKQTERVIRAMDHRRFHILGHPTGRLIGSRRAYAIDLERVLRAARERGCFIELNSQPDRMDLDDAHCRLAREIGVKVAISTDAHSEADLGYMSYGVSQARRGWLAATDVLNTRSWNDLKKLLRR